MYKHIDSPEYDALGCKRELFKATLLLTEQVALTLKRIGNNNADIKNVVTDAPSPLLPDFPFCSGVVEFDARISQTTRKKLEKNSKTTRQQLESRSREKAYFSTRRQQ